MVRSSGSHFNRQAHGKPREIALSDGPKPSANAPLPHHAALSPRRPINAAANGLRVRQEHLVAGASLLETLLPEVLKKTTDRLDRSSLQNLRATSRTLRMQMNANTSEAAIRFASKAAFCQAIRAFQAKSTATPQAGGGLKNLVLDGDAAWLDLALVADFHPNLRALDLSAVTGLEDVHLAAISRFKALQKLDLSLSLQTHTQDCISDTAIERLPTGLKVLELSGRSKLTGASLNRLTTLMHLNAAGCFGLTGPALAALPSSLVSLDLSDCIGLQTADFAALARLDQLKKLRLNELSNVTDGAG